MGMVTWAFAFQEFTFVKSELLSLFTIVNKCLFTFVKWKTGTHKI